jgi:signal transduction histidine kinase/integral membrane sensor domain MASE1
VPTEVWPPVGVGFIALTLVWDGASRPGRRAACVLAVMVVSFPVIAALFGHRLLESMVMAVLNVGAAALMALIYAWAKKSSGWAPQGARSLAAMMGAAVLASTALALFGGFPGQSFADSEALTLWWIIRSAIFAFIGGATFLTFFSPDLSRWRSQPMPSRLGLALLVPVSFVCMWVVYLDPELPLSWFLLIPAVWAGAMLTPYGAAIHALAQALVAGVLAFAPANRFEYDGLMPSSLVIDLLLSTCTFMTMHIALLRDERERAISAERALRQEADAESRLFGQIFDAMSDGIMLFDTDGPMLRHNTAARHLFGRPLPAPDRKWSSYLGLRHEDGRPLDDTELPGQPGIRQHRLRVTVDHAGDRRILDVSSWELPESEILVLLTDVTSQRQRLDELSRFAGIVSHDLRTPLTGLHGWLELAREAALDGRMEDIEPMLRRAESASLRMERVIGGWINYTVVREGKLTRERIVLSELIENVISTHARPDTKIVVDAPHAVNAAPDLVQQLLANLVGNAVKFAEPGRPAEIEIVSCDDGEPGWIRIDVADRGLGLPDGEDELIFEEFHRAPDHAEGVDGTGLGLSLCRTIVTRHGGSISAFTNEHGGATFTMTLPTAR